MDQLEILENYNGGQWTFCSPVKEDIVPGKPNVGVSFWDDNKWTRLFPFKFIDTRFDTPGNDSVIDVRTIRYLKHFESA
jgi:hypothetical protein